MLVRQRLRIATAGALRFQPPEGPPTSSASIVLYTPDGTVLQASTSATLPTVATTISSAADLGDATLSVASATGIEPGQWYWLGTYGEDVCELVQVQRVVSTTVYLVEPLRYDYASGQDLRGSELTYSVTTTHTETLNRLYRAEWTYEVDGTTYKAKQLWDVVREPFKLPLAPLELKSAIPTEIMRSAMDIGSEWDLIQMAEGRLYHELDKIDDIVPDRVRDHDQLKPAGLELAKSILLDRLAMTDAARYQTIADEQRQRFQAEFDRMLESGLSWYDEDEDEVVDSQLDVDGDGVPDYADETEEQDRRAGNYFLIG